MSSQLQAPPGGDVDRGPSAVATLWTMIGFGSVIVALRFWSRRMIRQTGADDWMMFATLICFLINTAIITHDAAIGGFRHLYYLTPAETVAALKYSWIAQAFVIMGFATGKISVGLLILRILGNDTFWRRWIIYFAMGTALLFTLMDIIFTYAQCNPVAALWDASLIASGQASCWNPKIQTDFAIFLASWNVCVDTLLAVLPVSIFWGLGLSLKRKISLCVLLGLGLVAAVCAAVKTQYLVDLNARSDLTWETYNLYVWSAAELFVIIMCGSMPPLKPIYDRFRKRTSEERHQLSGYHEYAVSSAGPQKPRHHVRLDSSPDSVAEYSALSPASVADLEKGPQELPGEEPYKPVKEHPAGDISVPFARSFPMQPPPVPPKH